MTIGAGVVVGTKLSVAGFLEVKKVLLSPVNLISLFLSAIDSFRLC